MKALLIKDFKLMKNMKNSLVIILLITVAMSFYNRNTSFIVAYLAIVGTSFTSSTISYDEFENGDTFLFSLPVSRKDYVLEKYLFSLVVCGGSWLVGSIVSIAPGMFGGGIDPMESIMTALMMLPVPICISVFLLPVRLKFGGEKSRIALMVVMGAFFLVAVVGVKIAQKLGIDLNTLEARISAMSVGMGIVVFLGVSIALLLISCQISIRIMEHKEF